MNYSDDQVQNEPTSVVSDETVDVDTQGDTMPKVVPVARARKTDESIEPATAPSFADAIITTKFKSLFFAL